jgi:hypothetical protein
MGLDIVVMDEDFKFIKELPLLESVHGLLFRKLVTPDKYPFLGRAQNDQEDITFQPEEVPALLADVVKLEQYLGKEKLMSSEVKKKCLDFVSKLKELCEVAIERKRKVEFVSGD